MKHMFKSNTYICITVEIICVNRNSCHCNVDCANILTHDGCVLQGVAELAQLEPMEKKHSPVSAQPSFHRQI